MQDKLIEVLNKIAENPTPNKWVLVKKAIIEVCQKKGLTQTQTLKLLNDILAEVNQKPVTYGCIKHWWNK